LIWRFSSIERGLKLHRYWSSSCQQGALRAKCTPSENRRVTRWEHEDLLDAMPTRLDLAPRPHVHPPPDCGTSLRYDQAVDGV
jgi:hypothetical protein